MIFDFHSLGVRPDILHWGRETGDWKAKRVWRKNATFLSFHCFLEEEHNTMFLCVCVSRISTHIKWIRQLTRYLKRIPCYYLKSKCCSPETDHIKPYMLSDTRKKLGVLCKSRNRTINWYRSVESEVMPKPKIPLPMYF